MTFATYEDSRASGEPVNLYLFTYGDGVTKQIGYCDAEQPITFSGVTYVPIPIDRSKITSSGTLDKANVTVTTPQDSDLANLYLIYPPSSVTTLIMRQGHVDDIDMDFKVVWTGRVVSCARKGSKAEFTCEPVSTSLRRNGLRRRYQFACPHVLYGPNCRADKTAATTSTTVAGISGSQITLPDGWATAPLALKYIGGIAQWQNQDGSTEIRTILDVSGGNTVKIAGSTQNLLVGQTVQMILGCNHKAGLPGVQSDGDCGPLHNNIHNFGGQPWIPFKNPINGLVNNYYGGAV